MPKKFDILGEMSPNCSSSHSATGWVFDFGIYVIYPNSKTLLLATLLVADLFIIGHLFLFCPSFPLWKSCPSELFFLDFDDLFFHINNVFSSGN